MDREYRDQFSELYVHHWWFRARESLLVGALARHLGGRTGLSLLDVGCADAVGFDAMSRFGEVTGIEPDPSAVSDEHVASRRVFVGTIDEFPDPSTPFDVVMMLDSLEHMADPHAALVRARGLARAGGMLLLTVPAFEWLWTAHDELSHHHLRYSKSTLEAVVRKSGWQVVESRYLFPSLVPAKLAIRAKEAIVGARPSVPGVPPQWLNNLLRRFLLAEHRLLGRRAPVGTSLLMLAERRG